MQDNEGSLPHHMQSCQACRQARRLIALHIKHMWDASTSRFYGVKDETYYALPQKILAVLRDHEPVMLRH